MANFYFASRLENGTAIIQDDLHHIVRVARHRVGEEIGVLFPPGRGRGKIISVDSASVVVKLSFWEEFSFSPVKITVAVPLIKEEPLKEVVRHSVELGVFKILLLETERSRRIKHVKVEKLKKIVKEAAKQSGNPLLPDIETADLTGVCLRGIFMDQGGMDFSEYTPVEGENCIVVGPEGGLTEMEKELLVKRGFVGVKFGDMILKSETAVLAGVTLGKYLWKSHHEKVSILWFQQS